MRLFADGGGQLSKFCAIDRSPLTESLVSERLRDLDETQMTSTQRVSVHELKQVLEASAPTRGSEGTYPRRERLLRTSQEPLFFREV